MTLQINTNVAALNTQRALTRNTRALSTSFERLSTGLRINSAKDDAAGLAISERFTSQIRGLNQAVRNANDGVSLAQTAEAALNQMLGGLQRIRELAVQAANDTNSVGDRVAIQAEVDQLVEEIDRISTQTNFNDRLILDGSFSDRVFQIGAGSGQNISVTINSARAFNLGAQAVQAVADVSNNPLGTDELTLNGIAVRPSSGNDDQLSYAANDASAIAKASAINSGAPDHGVRAIVEPNTNAPAEAIAAGTIAAGDIVINGIDIGAVTVQADDADSALRNAINAVSSRTGVQATLNGANELVLTANDGRNVTFEGADLTGGGVFGANLGGGAPGTTVVGSLRLESDTDISVAGTTPANAGLAVGNTAVNTAVNLTTLSLATQAGADEALQVLDVAIRQVAGQQADLGALLSRFESTVSNLSAISENLSAARSRIRDADFAKETAEFSRNQILQQSAIAILGQANVAPQVALQLIGG
jgi:flagellin